MRVSHSVVSNSVTPRSVDHQVPLSIDFSRQEYRRGLPFPSPRDLPSPGIEPGSPASQTDCLPSEPPGKPKKTIPSDKEDAEQVEFFYTARRNIK